MKRSGTAPAALNAANEEAVKAFLAGQIRFGQIAEINRTVLENHSVREPSAIEDVLEADADARKRAIIEIEKSAAMDSRQRVGAN